MPPITAPAPSEVMGIHANCVNICRSRFAARSASDPDASMVACRVPGSSGIGWTGLCHCVFGFHLDSGMARWHRPYARWAPPRGGVRAPPQQNEARAQHNADQVLRKCVTETQCSSHAWPRWRAPRRVLSLPLRCVRFMRLAHGTPTRPPKVRAARSPLLPQALRCPLR